MQSKDKAIKERKFGARKVVKEVYVYAILLAVIVVLTLLQGEIGQRGNFLFWPNLSRIIRESVPIIMISAVFTYIFVTGNIDLSVGSTVSMTVVIYTIMLLNGFGFIPALLLTLVVGVAAGAVNGLLVMKLRITPVIATLITMSAYQGIARYLVPEGVSAIKSGEVLKMPEWITDLSRGDIFPKDSGITSGISWAVIVAIVVIAILVFLQKKTVLGKYTVAVGGNRTAAELSGINAVKVVWGVYMLIGLVTAFAGVVRASNMSIGDPYTGIGMETEAIIACLLGGTVFTGGEGSVMKSVIGALIIAFLTLGLKSVIDPYYQTLAKGVVLVLAVALNHQLTKEKVEVAQ